MDIEFVVDEYIEKGKLIGDNETVDAIIAELAAAKEEIVRLKADLDRHADRSALEVGKSHAAESSLTSERKETERLREALRQISTNGWPLEMRSIALAALQSRHGEE